MHHQTTDIYRLYQDSDDRYWMRAKERVARPRARDATEESDATGEASEMQIGRPAEIYVEAMWRLWSGSLLPDQGYTTEDICGRVWDWGDWCEEYPSAELVGAWDLAPHVRSASCSGRSARRRLP